MKRFLFVVPPLAGHVNPTISVARELESRGHEVAWVGHPTALRPLLPPGARLYELEEQVMGRALFAETLERSRRLRGLPAFKFLWEEVFVPLARFMRPGVEEAVEQFQPSVLVADQQAVAGSIVARHRQMRWATFCTTSAAVTECLGDLPLVRQWRDDLLGRLLEEAGLPQQAQPDLSPHLVVVFSTLALVGSTGGAPGHFAFVGPSIEHRPSQVAFPWEALRADVPRVLISMGTVNGPVSGRFFHTAIEALRDEPLQVILAAPEGVVSAGAANVIVRPFVPQLDLLSHVHAVVCHAGHNTVCEALAHGLPLVVAPIKDDQPVVAEQVARVGAGVRVSFGRVGPEGLRRAVRRVLDEPSFRESAECIRRSFEQAGGATAAADRLIVLARAGLDHEQSHIPEGDATTPRAVPQSDRGITTPRR